MVIIFFIAAFLVGIISFFVYQTPKHQREGRELIRECHDRIKEYNARIYALDAEYACASFSERRRILRQSKRLADKKYYQQQRLKALKMKYGL